MITGQNNIRHMPQCFVFFVLFRKICFPECSFKYKSPYSILGPIRFKAWLGNTRKKYRPGPFFDFFSVDAIHPRQDGKFSTSQWHDPNPRKPPRSRCRRCGGNHRRDINSCPAKDAECYKCHTIGHWAQVCIRARKGPGKHVHSISQSMEREDNNTEDGLFEEVEYNCISIEGIT